MPCRTAPISAAVVKRMKGVRWSRSWTARTLIALLVLGPILLFLIAAIYSIATLSDDMTWVGRRRHAPTLVPTWKVQIVSLPPLLGLCSLLLWRVGRGMLLAYRECRDARADAGSAIDTSALLPGEVIRWQGKQGWRSMARARLTVFCVAVLGLVGILLLLW